MAESLWRYIPRLRARDGDCCMICREPADFALRRPDPMAVTVDHLIPRSLGGHTVLANLRLAHYACNHDRGNGLNSRRRSRPVPVAPSVLNEPGDVPVAVCWDLGSWESWSAARS